MGMYNIPPPIPKPTPCKSIRDHIWTFDVIDLNNGVCVPLTYLANEAGQEKRKAAKSEAEPHHCFQHIGVALEKERQEETLGLVNIMVALAARDFPHLSILNSKCSSPYSCDSDR